MTEPAEPDASSDDTFLATLNDIIREALTPEAKAARAVMLQRLAQQGDVIPSRLPAPRSITEIGGYLNLLEELGLPELRSSVLSSVLGVAAPPPVPELPRVAALPLTTIRNSADRSPMAGVAVRADFAAPLAATLARIASAGGSLPLWAPPPVLPVPVPGTASPGEADALFALGRRLLVAPTQTMKDPDTDPVVLGRVESDPKDRFRLAVRVAAGAAEIVDEVWQGLVRTDKGVKPVKLGKTPLAPLSVYLDGSGFVVPSVAPPATQADLGWATATITAGLLPQVSRLGNELALSHGIADIMRSPFASRTYEVWDGARFGRADPHRTPRP
jgi:hypothetical protein